MIKRETKNTLQSPSYPHVLRIVELRASGVVILEGSDATRCTKQMKDVAHCPLPMTGGTWCCAMGAKKGTMYFA